MACAFPPLGITILVVDDERLSRRVAYRLLSEEAKPYTRDELVIRVREALERRSIPRSSDQISSEPS